MECEGGSNLRLGRRSARSGRKGNPISVWAFTLGSSTPSARFRVHQLVPILSKYNISLRVNRRFMGIGHAGYARAFWAFFSLLCRLPSLVMSRGADVVLFQRPLVSSVPTFEWAAGKPRILDVDDAIHIGKTSRSWINRLASNVDTVVVGNKFLFEHYVKYNKAVEVIPTPVDCAKYRPLKKDMSSESPIVGWIGTSRNLKYVYSIEQALADVLAAKPSAKLLIVSNEEPKFSIIPKNRVVFQRWSPNVEVSSIQQMTVGLMPLDDGPWEQGKCSYKMLQYMACGVPVVVSPVGMNGEVLSLGKCGFAASNRSEWFDYICAILDDPDMAFKMGKTGRDIVVKHYDLASVGERWAELIYRVTSKR